MLTQFKDINRREYSDFYENHNLAVHFAPWYLDAVCHYGQWNVNLSKSKDGVFQGVLVYYVRNKMGIKAIVMPPLTMYSGLWLNYPPGMKYHSKIAFTKKVSNELYDQLPSYPIYIQQFHPTIDNWLPLYWKKYKQTTLYTYRIGNIKDHDSVWGNFRTTLRNHIRGAEKVFTVIPGEEFSQFEKALQLSFSKRNRSTPYDFTIFRRLDKALASKSQRKIFFAHDPEKNIAAGVYVSFDKEMAYIIANFHSPDKNNSGAVCLLIWHVIKEMSKQVQSIDFEGSTIPQIEEFNRSFGGVLTPHYRVYKFKNLMFRMAVEVFGKSLIS
jgi:hypothetical protein